MPLHRLILRVRNWPALLLARAKKKQGLVHVRMRLGAEILLRMERRDIESFADTWISDAFDPAKNGVAFDWSTVRTAMDIGAHVGAFTLFAATKAVQARIIAVEPEQGNFALLKRNIEMNGLTGRIAVENVGVGSGEDTPLYDASGEHRLEPVALAGSGEPVIIHTVTLTALLEKYAVSRLDLLRLDCEGAEYDALYSLTDDMLRRIRCIVMEYHHVTLNPAHRAEHLIPFLESKGFRIVPHRPSMLIAIRE